MMPQCWRFNKKFKWILYSTSWADCNAHEMYVYTLETVILHEVCKQNAFYAVMLDADASLLLRSYLHLRQIIRQW